MDNFSVNFTQHMITANQHQHSSDLYVSKYRFHSIENDIIVNINDDTLLKIVRDKKTARHALIPLLYSVGTRQETL